jgi:hypothetical protein
LPGFWRTQFALAAIHGQLGEQDAARYAIKELLKIRPDFAQVGEAELRKWWNLEFTEHLIDGLRKAGLKLSSE